MEEANKIVQHFYAHVYQSYLYAGGPSQAGQTWASKFLESRFHVNSPRSILEIGGGSGEHLSHVKSAPSELYASIDLRDTKVDVESLNIDAELKSVLRFDVGDVQALPYESQIFDRVLGTCVLHHIRDPFAALQEVRRVARTGAEICFVLPTDPGIMNRLIKKFVTFPKLRRLSSYPPELFYALDHQNHVESLIQMFKYVFRKDQVSICYSPFRFRSWNLNLLVTLKATIN